MSHTEQHSGNSEEPSANKELSKEPSVNEKLSSSEEDRLVSVTDSLFIGVLLLLLVGGAILLFGSDSMSGSTQIAMLMTGFIAALVGMKNGFSWQQLEQAIVSSSARATGAILIFLSIGSLISSFMLSGAVPTLLYYGLQILSPHFFYPLCCVISALVAICIGSSWTAAATIGVGLMGVSIGFSLSPEVTAGAVISGAYFGDKMSPLSDTTNLAPTIAGSELFTHIRHMAWVSVPSFVVAMVLFALVGFGEAAHASNQTELMAFIETLDASFVVAWYNLVPILLLLGLAVKKVPAFLSVLIGTVAACFFALVFQPEAIQTFIGGAETGAFISTVKAIWIVLYDGFQIQTGNENVNSLLSRGGMVSMLTMAWLVICSMMMTGVLEKIGFIQMLLTGIAKLIHSAGSLIAGTMATCFGVNVLTGDQYLSIVLPGQMWKLEYEKRSLDARNLSRTLEDSGTLTSPLIPWNACGVFMAGSLGVPTLAYLPYCFFNLMNPVLALAYGFLDIKIKRLESAAIS